MDYVALWGKTGSGKSSVAAALEERGYLVVEYSNLLKVAAVVALNSVRNMLPTPVRPEFTLSEIIANKEEFRPFLQHLGTHSGFDAGGAWIDFALEMVDWEQNGKPKIVIDCLRTNMQAARCLVHGIEVVELKASKAELQRRAQQRGLTVAEYQANQRHPVEQELLWVDFRKLAINTRGKTPEQIAEVIVRA